VMVSGGVKNRTSRSLSRAASPADILLNYRSINCVKSKGRRA
jgi:hypothetical protein